MASLLPITVSRLPKRKVAVAPPDPYAPLVKMALSGVQTPAQVAATANTQALAQEKAMLAASKAVSDQAISQYNNQATRAEGFAGALARLQAGEDQQAQARYSESADRLAGLGAGLTGAVGAGYQSGVDRTREAVANLTGGLGSVTATPGADISNAAQYAGAAMPANTLESNAAAAARMTQSDAASRALNLHHIGQDYTGKADEAIAQAASDARALIAKRPATIAELVNQLNTNRQTGISNLAGVLSARTGYRQTEQKRLDDLKQTSVANKLAIDKFQSDNAHWIAEDARATRQVDLTEKALDNTIRTTGANILGTDPETGMPTLSSVQANRQWQGQLAQIAQNQSAQNGYRMVWRGGKLTPQLDAKGNLVPLGGFKLGKGGQSVTKSYAPSSSSTGGVGWGGLTASGRSSLIKTAQRTIRDGLKTSQPGQLYQPDAPEAQQLKDADGNPTGFIADPNKPGKNAVPYADALSNAIAGGPNTKQWAARATQLVQAAYAPGQNGRPWTKPTATKAAMGTAQLAYKNGMHVTDLTAAMQAANLPADVIATAIRKVYFGPARSPINGIPPTADDFPGG